MNEFRAAARDWLLKLSPNVRRAMDHRTSEMKMKPRIIFDYELLYLEKGRLTVRIADAVHAVGPGEMILFKPGKEHEFIRSSGECRMPHVHFDALYEEDFEDVPINFKPRADCTDRELGWIREDVLGERLRLPDIISIDNHEQAARTLHQLIHAYERRDRHFAILQKSLMLKLLHLIVTGLAAGRQPTSHHPSLEAAATLIMERFDQPIRLEALSRQATLSIFHFSRLFKQRFGLTPHQFQLRYRMEKAKDLLVYSPLSVSTIAEKVGYGSVYAFSKAFKQAEGISPRQFVQTYTGH